MDGAGRLPRQIEAPSWPGLAALTGHRFGAPALLAAGAGWLEAPAKNPQKTLPAAVRAHERRVSRPTFAGNLGAILARPFVGAAFAALVLGAAGVAGAVRGGQYDAFVANHGALYDVAARALGFGVAAVVITSDNGIANDLVLKASGVTTLSSLPFLSAANLRERLKALPIVKEASVRKLYPDRLVINIEQREPFALWQKDGKVAVISADGAAIGALEDDRFVGLPFVVGEGANLRAAEFAQILDGAGELRDKIRAGVLVAGRRWDLKMTNGVDVKLPEKQPLKALAALADLQRDAHVLDKDIVFLDFRLPGRMAARMTEEAADNRAAARALKKSAKAGQ